MSVFLELLKDFGFPVAVCGVLFWYVYHINEANNKKLEALEKTIAENTTALASFNSLLDTTVNKFDTIILEVFKKGAGEGE